MDCIIKQVGGHVEVYSSTGRSCFRPTTPARPWKSWRAEAAFLQLCLSARTNDLLLPVQNAGQPCNIKQNAVVFFFFL